RARGPLAGCVPVRATAPGVLVLRRGLDDAWLRLDPARGPRGRSARTGQRGGDLLLLRAGAERATGALGQSGVPPELRLLGRWLVLLAGIRTALPGRAGLSDRRRPLPRPGDPRDHRGAVRRRRRGPGAAGQRAAEARNRTRGVRDRRGREDRNR